MKVSPALRAAVHGFEKSSVVSAARNILPYLDKTLSNISGGVYLDGAELGTDEAAILRIVIAQALTGKVDTKDAPCMVIGAIFYRKDGEGEPVNYDTVRQMAHAALRLKAEEGPVDTEDFVFGWIADHYSSLDELINMDDNWGL